MSRLRDEQMGGGGGKSEKEGGQRMEGTTPVDRKGAYSAVAPTLRSNATTSGLFPSMAILRGVSPSLQAGG
jgi:hypothetical protein